MFKGLFLILCSCSPLFSVEKSYCKNLKTSVTVLSIPKSGSHLVDRCIRLLLNNRFKKLPSKMSILDIPIDLRMVKNHVYILKHFAEDEIENDFLLNNSKIIINIRDLRDVCISFYNRNIIPEQFRNASRKWERMSQEQQIMYFIKDESVFSIPKQVPRAIRLLETYPDILITRFENLVGPNGGGSREKQEDEIQKIAAYLEIPLDDKKLDYVIANLYGESSTFKKGQIGSWRTMYNSDHLQEFNLRLGKYLEYFGYESD